MGLWQSIGDPSVRGEGSLIWDGDRYRPCTYTEHVDAAAHVGAALRRAGVRPGDVVPIALTNSSAAIAGLVGIWTVGAVPASVPLPARGMSLDAYLDQLYDIVTAVGDGRRLLAEERLIHLFGNHDHPLIGTLLGLNGLSETAASVEPSFDFPDDMAFVQYSSGTTERPSGVMLSAQAIEAQVAMLTASLEIDPERDRGTTWLPLSHDMGLFGCLLLSWANGMPGMCGTPERFLASPGTWLDDCAAFGATVTSAPPFALSLAARAHQRQPVRGSLSEVRVCTLGGDHIDVVGLQSAMQQLAAAGLSWPALNPAYGLAEATLGVTMTELGSAPILREIPDDAVADGVRELVAAGQPIEGTRLRITDDGEVAVCSPSLCDGYLGDAARTAERLVDGELLTGDLGVLQDGQLFITGRKDDLLISGGRNFSAAPIESALGQTPGVRRGGCMLVDTRHIEDARIVLLAELQSECEDLPAMARRLRQTAMAQSGLAIDECVFVAPGSLPKTASGKLQRYRGRELALDGNGQRVPLRRGS